MTAAALPGVRHVLHTVNPDRTTPAAARRWLGPLLGGRVPATIRDDALLVGSELVTNAIEHGPDGADVYLAATVLEGAIELLVHDSGAAFETADAGPDAESGRGLLIAEALAQITYDIRNGSTEIRALIPITKEAAS